MINKRWLSRAAYSGMFLFGIVMALLGAVLPVLSERIQFGLGEAGTLFLTMNLAMLVTMLGLGPLMDRFGLRLPLIGGSLLVGLTLALIAGTSRYTALLADVFLLGIGGGCLNGAANTLVADLHEEARQKSSALNLLGVFFGFGALFLPFLIGSLLKSLGLNVILYFATVLSFLSSILLLLLDFPSPKQTETFVAPQAARLICHPLVLLLGFLLFFQSGNEFITGGFASSFLKSQLNSSVATASYILAAYWGSIMLTRVMLSRLLLQWKGPTLVLASSLLSASGSILLVFSTSVTLAAFAIVVIGVGFAGIFPTTLGLAGSRFEAHSGTVFGILFAIALTGGMTLPWVVGQIAATQGLRAGLILVIFNSLMISILQMMISLRYSQKAQSSPA